MALRNSSVPGSFGRDPRLREAPLTLANREAIAMVWYSNRRPV